MTEHSRQITEALRHTSTNAIEVGSMVHADGSEYRNGCTAAVESLIRCAHTKSAVLIDVQIHDSHFGDPKYFVW